MALLMMLFVPAASAQSAGQVILFPLNMDTFPRMTTYLDVRDVEGFFVSSLQASHVTLLENGLEVPATELKEIRPGGQIVLAVNAGDSFGIRDSQGFTRFDYVSAGMDSWLLQLGSANVDDLTIVVPEGELITHELDFSKVLNSWRNYQPEFETASPTLDVISRAIDFALDSPPVEGMGRAIILLTPALPEEFAGPLESLIDRAAQANIRIHVWVIDSESLFASDQTAPLRAMAQQTDGQYFGFSGAEPLPDVNSLLESVRRVYSLSYRSHINSAGLHQLAVRVSGPTVQLATEAIEFDVQLQAPNPIFIALPAQIVRAIPEDARIEIENYAPNTQLLEVLFDFPDTIQRDIVRTTLFVNGEQVLENLAAPFDLFEFDVSGYTESTRLFVSVESEDELGLVGKSIETPIQITVQQPQRGFFALVARNLPAFAASIAVVAGMGLFLVLVMAGRLRPQTLPERTRPRAATNDPVTQPLDSVQAQLIEPTTAAKPSRQQEIGRMTWLAKRFGRMPWTQPETPKQSVAYLVPVSTTGEKETGEVFPLEQRETVFGSESGVSSVVIDDPAIEARHARLWQDGDGLFHIADEKTIAGTWVNYAPVTADGAVLQHGDLVHIAKRGYRFTLSNPVNPRIAVIKPIEESELL